LGLVFFELHQFVHDELPVARGNLLVAGGEKVIFATISFSSHPKSSL
jgi:hypothetical protein